MSSQKVLLIKLINHIYNNVLICYINSVSDK